MPTILLIILILLLLGAVPAWPYSRNWGYYPSGGLGLVVVILLILLLMGRYRLERPSRNAFNGRARRKSCPFCVGSPRNFAILTVFACNIALWVALVGMFRQ